tara:strand:+ start:11579 stop:11902 length:324 start_codon:yes stop_codon:yes gene_type:complete
VRRLDTVFRNVRVFAGIAVDFPSIGSIATVSGDITTVATFPLGTALITWGFESDASVIQDLQIQFIFINANTLRWTLSNPTAGAIDPGILNMFFVTGEVNTDLSETI